MVSSSNGVVQGSRSIASHAGWKEFHYMGKTNKQTKNSQSSAASWMLMMGGSKESFVNRLTEHCLSE